MLGAFRVLAGLAFALSGVGVVAAIAFARIDLFAIALLVLAASADWRERLSLYSDPYIEVRP